MYVAPRFFSVLICAVAASVACGQSPEFEAYWSFDDTPGSAISQDGTGNNRDLSINTAGGGTPGIVTGGRFGNTLSLNNNTGTFAEADGPGGSNSYLGVLGTTARTVSAWIRPAGTPQDDAIINWGTNTSQQKWTIRTENTANQFRAEFANGGTEHSALPGTLFDSSWHHVAVTYPGGATGTGADVTLYVDGVPGSVDLTDGTPLSTVAADVVRVGLDLSNRPFNGEIDDVGIFSRAMTDSEIAAIYNLAEETELNYDLGDADLVLDVYNNGGEVTIGDLVWRQTTGLNQTEGELVASGSGFLLQLDDAGNGVLAFAVPEPSTIAMWTLLGIALAGTGYARRRRNK